LRETSPRTCCRRPWFYSHSGRRYRDFGGHRQTECTSLAIQAQEIKILVLHR
jgi:hypothetical protein